MNIDKHFTVHDNEVKELLMALKLIDNEHTWKKYQKIMMLEMTSMQSLKLLGESKFQNGKTSTMN